ncbi:hypothetical protein BH23CHL2_BH23CHL2_13790 [soil metagenome]
MLGWLVMLGMGGLGLLVSAIFASRWGRGSNEGMSVSMESESASYVNFTRGQNL